MRKIEGKKRNCEQGKKYEKQTKTPESLILSGEMLAEKEGFEPLQQEAGRRWKQAIPGGGVASAL